MELCVTRRVPGKGAVPEGPALGVDTFLLDEALCGVTGPVQLSHPQGVHTLLHSGV